ncbi:rhodanese-related sulfurtransferase [Pararhizobium sp. IMCC21322]|uniref:oxygen-dependent tRNA uridine(34) hydroxylase TrhO n=1 Tax=Pararhizobium sp. IMCC21322 TaxID=3067903 RepID=UPI002742678B|nr:rhodanese-related sulfurtransferase [Pararhizobium sp. IMCC21322]
MNQTTDNKDFLVAALYRFTPVENPEALQEPIKQLCDRLRVKGSLLLATEGINGTIAGVEQDIRECLQGLKQFPEFAELEHKESFATEMPFYRMKVRLKKEIVTMGVEGIDPLESVGTYVPPQDWNDLISDPDTIVIDTRNDYEVAIGTFDGAIDPKTKSFRDFPAWVEANKRSIDKPKVAMFCTGGIRCEKATAFMKQQGFDEVYHLQGGILKYLEEVPQDQSLWHGDCFVFDQRVSVQHGLVEGPHVLCFGCRMPLSEADLERSEYRAGVHCHHCRDSRTASEHKRAEERHKQVLLAQMRNEQHIGDNVG